MATKKTAAAGESESFTEGERAAMKERAKELKSSATKAGKDTEPEVLAKIAELPPSDRAISERIHTIVREVAPDLMPKLWYGQPAYARDGKVICFLQPSSKFGLRYSTLGFNQDAQLDDGSIWPTSFAITTLSKADEKRVADLIKKATSSP